MKKLRLILSLSLIVFLTLTPVSYSKTYTVSQLTNTARNCSEVQINDNGQVVWDGSASWQFSNAGDDTVLTASTALGGIASTTKAGGHGDLPNVFRQEAFNFITGQAGQAPQIEQTPPDSGERSLPPLKKLLFIGTRSNVLMGIATPEGDRVGRFPDEKEKIAELELYYYRGNEQKTPALGIYNPSEGAYILTITTKDPEAVYEIHISYSDHENGGEQRVTVKGSVKNDQVKKHMIKIINKKLEAN